VLMMLLAAMVALLGTYLLHSTGLGWGHHSKGYPYMPCCRHPLPSMPQADPS